VIDATSPHTLRSDTVDTHERSDTIMLVKKSFLTSQESRTALQWVVSHVPAAAPTCHLRVRPHALSLTSCFITLRGLTWPRDRITAATFALTAATVAATTSALAAATFAAAAATFAATT